MPTATADERAIPDAVSARINPEIVADGETKNESDNREPTVAEPSELLVEVPSESKKRVKVAQNEFENEEPYQPAKKNLQVGPLARR